MKPKATVHQAQRELFRTELEGLVDAGHALVKMGRQMNWAVFGEQLGQTYDPSTGAPGMEARLEPVMNLKVCMVMGENRTKAELPDGRKCRGVGFRGPVSNLDERGLEST